MATDVQVERGYTNKDGRRVGFYETDDGERFFYTPDQEMSRESAKGQALKDANASVRARKASE